MPDCNGFRSKTIEHSLTSYCASFTRRGCGDRHWATSYLASSHSVAGINGRDAGTGRTPLHGDIGFSDGTLIEGPICGEQCRPAWCNCVCVSRLHCESYQLATLMHGLTAQQACASENNAQRVQTKSRNDQWHSTVRHWTISSPSKAGLHCLRRLVSCY